MTEFVATRSIALPFFNQITKEQLDEVCDALRESLDQAATLPLQPVQPTVTPGRPAMAFAG